MTDLVTPPRQRAAWDIVLTVVLLVASAIIVIGAAIIDIVAAVIASSCRTDTCDGSAALAAVAISWFSMFIVLVVGAIASVILLVRRRIGWWVALIAFVLIVAFWIIGFVLYSAAVNHAVVDVNALSALLSAV